MIPGRAFTRRLYYYTRNDGKFKPHHHMRVSQEMRLDLSMWKIFLHHHTALSRHFLDFSEKGCINANTVDMDSDAAGNFLLGIGATCAPNWIYVQWNKDFCEKVNPSIEYLELYAVLMGVLLWIERFRNKRIILFCDNMSVVNMINNNSSSCKNCMVLIRLLVLKGLIENVRIFAAHLSSKANCFSDALSRLKLDLFWRLSHEKNKKFNPQPNVMPPEIWPMEKIWLAKLAMANTIVHLTSFAGKSTKHKKNQKIIDESTTSTISSRHIEEILDNLKMTRDTTAKNYYGIWKKFNKFVIRLDVKPKTWECRVALYGAHLIETAKQSSTVKLYFSAIKRILYDGLKYEFNDNDMLLTSIAKACHLKNNRVQTRLPISLALLNLILGEIGKLFKTQTYLKLMYRTMFALAFHGLLRIGEISESPHVIKAREVQLGTNKDKILLVLYSSKTHGKESHLQKIKISKITHDTGMYCPFRLLSTFSKLRRQDATEEEQFFVFRDGSPVKPHHLRTVMTDAIQALGLNHNCYTFHSLCIGMASRLIKLGYDIEVIKWIGHWKSNAVYKYICE